MLCGWLTSSRSSFTLMGNTRFVVVTGISMLEIDNSVGYVDQDFRRSMEDSDAQPGVHGITPQFMSLALESCWLHYSGN